MQRIIPQINSNRLLWFIMKFRQIIVGNFCSVRNQISSQLFRALIKVGTHKCIGGAPSMNIRTRLEYLSMYRYLIMKNYS